MISTDASLSETDIRPANAVVWMVRADADGVRPGWRVRRSARPCLVVRSGILAWCACPRRSRSYGRGWAEAICSPVSGERGECSSMVSGSPVERARPRSCLPERSMRFRPRAAGTGISAGFAIRRCRSEASGRRPDPCDRRVRLRALAARDPRSSPRDQHNGGACRRRGVGLLDPSLRPPLRRAGEHG